MISLVNILFFPKTLMIVFNPRKGSGFYETIFAVLLVAVWIYILATNKDASYIQVIITAIVSFYFGQKNIIYKERYDLRRFRRR